jgi:large subunit ribosomal protein L25
MQPPIAIHVEAKLLIKYMSNWSLHQQRSSMIDTGNGKPRSAPCPRTFQFHPVTDRPLHADFLRICRATFDRARRTCPSTSSTKQLSPGLKRGGGAQHRPPRAGADLRRGRRSPTTSRSIAHRASRSAIRSTSAAVDPACRAPESAIDDRDFTIATIVAPSVLRSEEGDNAKTDAEPADPLSGRSALTAASKAGPKRGPAFCWIVTSRSDCGANLGRPRQSRARNTHFPSAQCRLHGGRCTIAELHRFGPVQKKAFQGWAATKAASAATSSCCSSQPPS